MAAGNTKYTVKNRVEHDKTVYEPGQTIELADKHAQALLDVKAIEAIPEKTEKK